MPRSAKIKPITEPKVSPTAVIEKGGMRSITSSNPPPMVINKTKYQVWSSVLGSSLTVVAPDGDKVETKVFAGGTHIATQNAEGSSSPNEGQILFHTADPVTGTVGTFTGSGTFTVKEEYEPLGQQIETTDPDPYPATYADWQGMGKDPEWQCLAWEEFRSGDFVSMPVHCQKKIVQGGRFSIPAALGYSDREEDPTRVTEPADSPIRDLAPMDSQADAAMSYALAATSKPDKEDDNDTKCRPGRPCLPDEEVKVDIPLIDVTDTGLEDASTTTMLLGDNDYPGFSKNDLKTVKDALKYAKDMTKDKKCDEALKDYGIPSVAKLLEGIIVEGANANTFDGRKSTLTFKDSDGKEKTISAYFKEKKATVGAAVFWGLGPKNDNVMFIGDYFFNPTEMENVAQQRAFMIMHESVHQTGKKSDADFDGSRKLSQKLVDKCFPVLKGKLGGVA